VAMNPRAAVASNNLAWLYAEGGGNLDVALQLAQAAHAQLTDNPQVNDTLGWVYYKKGLSTKAVASFRESLQAGGNPVYQYHLGLAYAQHGDKQEARKALEQALQLNPKFEGAADVRRLLAEMKG
jgi:tetratricopeptide (TPR) repeat protein